MRSASTCTAWSARARSVRCGWSRAITCRTGCSSKKTGTGGARLRRGAGCGPAAAAEPAGRSRGGVRRDVQSNVRGGLPRGRAGRARPGVSDIRRRPRADARPGRGRAELAGPAMGRGRAMKLGLLTAAFADLTLEQVARWAHDNGFEALEIACWPPTDAAVPRYPGRPHIDLQHFHANAPPPMLPPH